MSMMAGWLIGLIDMIQDPKLRGSKGSASSGVDQGSSTFRRAMAHYIGLDVGTGSARACLIDDKGDILSVAVKEIKTWHERADYYVIP